MRTVKIVSLRNLAIVAERCEVADSFMSRLIGLLGKKGLERGQALLLTPCNDIHMWFMKFSIDVIFLKNSDLKDPAHLIVTSMRKSLKPWTLFPVRDGNASATLEAPAGTIQTCDLQVGDTLCIS